MRTRLLVLVVLAFGVAGCERGCGGSKRSAAPTAGGTTPRGSSAVDLGGTDCSDGLARCNDGQVEVSVAAHLPHPCAPGEKTSPKAHGPCECPWRRIAGVCPRGCAKDGLEVVAEEAVAATQLCAPDPAAPVVRELLATELTTVTICADESVSCEAGVVTVCTARGQPARRIAGCVHGCLAGPGGSVSIDPGDLLTSDGAASILCRRAHAERR